MQVDRELEWTARALFDYENLAEYLFWKWDEGIALRVLGEIDHQVTRIRKDPEQFPIFIKEKEIRRCVASRQTSIFFTIGPTKIYLLSVFDNRLDPQKYPA